MSLGRLFDKALAVKDLIVNLLLDVGSWSALREDASRLESDIRMAWASIDTGRRS